MTSTFKAAITERYVRTPTDYKIATLPVPAPPSDTQVEIAVHAVSLNPIDYKRAEGMIVIPLPEPFPLRLGYDVSGTVTKIGSAVTRFKVGQSVYGRVEQASVGTIAEIVVANESSLSPKPDNISHKEAASIPLAGLTALQVFEKAGLKEGQSVFVSAGCGGVGQLALPLAKHHFKAKDIITTVSTKKIDKAKALGATRVVDYTKEDVHKVLENSADVVFDTTGDSSSYMIAKPNSHAVSIALLASGDAIDGFRDDSVPMSYVNCVKIAIAKRLVGAVGWFVTRGFRAKGVSCEFLLMNPDGRALETVFNPLLATGKIKPMIASVYPFTDDG
ncbi:hypothetical protein EC988_003370, partial [Linderina pennispora]